MHIRALQMALIDAVPIHWLFILILRYISGLNRIHSNHKGQADFHNGEFTQDFQALWS
jgi:hypothetical protein